MSSPAKKISERKLTDLLVGMILALALCFVPLVESMQPKVTTVESTPAQRLVGSLMMPEGSPWCGGLPTYWLVGHHLIEESPWCLNANGQWYQPKVVLLDRKDELSAQTGGGFVDRHACVDMDVNNDGLPDIICTVGAAAGVGVGWTEIYLTLPNGSVSKVLRHGLQKYPSVRARGITKLKGPNGEDLVMIGALGFPRKDGEVNDNRMYRKIEEPTFGGPLFFEEVDGPWQFESIEKCLVVVDLNNDGLDDIIMCNRDDPAYYFTQNADGTWDGDRFPGWYARRWADVRVADVTGDGVPDLLVVSENGSGGTSTFRVFQGRSAPPYFDFSSDGMVFRRWLPNQADSLEVLDVNDDGLVDVYLVQADRLTPDTYCAPDKRFNSTGWWETRGHPDDFVPPLDEAKDFLLLGNDLSQDPSQDLFQAIRMKHSEPGCGYWVEKFGDNRTLVLGQGDGGRPGHSLLLEW